MLSLIEWPQNTQVTLDHRAWRPSGKDGTSTKSPRSQSNLTLMQCAVQTSTSIVHGGPSHKPQYPKDHLPISWFKIAHHNPVVLWSHGPGDQSCADGTRENKRNILNCNVINNLFISNLQRISKDWSIGKIPECAICQSARNS